MSKPREKSEAAIDEALEDTFPASDPPAFVAGPEPVMPKKRKPAGDFGQDFGTVNYVAIRH